MADTIPSDKSASSHETSAPRALLPASTATSAPASPASTATAEPAASTQPAVGAPSHNGGVKSFHLLVLLIVFAITGVGSLMLLASAMQPPAADRHDPSAPADVAA